MTKDNLILALECIAMVVFAVFAVWFFTNGYYRMQPVVEPVMEEDLVCEPNTEDFTNFVTDFYTMCESAEQFGIDYSHTIKFEDCDVVMTECTTQFDNSSRNAHTVVFQPTYSIEMWFNDFVSYNYVTLCNSNTNESTDWVDLDYNKCDGSVSEFVRQQNKYVSNLQTVEKLLTYINEVDDYSCYNYDTITKIHYKTDNLPEDLFKSILGSNNNVNSYSIDCLINNNDLYTVKFVLNTYYAENDYGIIGDTYTYQLVLTDDYYLDVPDIVKTKSSTIKDLELLYNKIMYTEG